MQPFVPGIVLPFQKGVAVKKSIVTFQPIEPVRIPLMRIQDGLQPDIRLQEDEPCVIGQVLYQENEQEVPALSSICGTVSGTVAIEHPQYGALLCAELHPTGRDKQQDIPLPDTDNLSPDDILRIAKDAAIYDELDGVPLYEKLAAWQLPDGDIAALHSVLVADATENDIFGSAAWAVLKEEAKEAIAGLQLAAQALRFNRYHIATMLPKARRRALKRAIGRINVHIVGDEYPVIDYADSKDEAFRIGVQACVALARAVESGQVADSIVLTVAGDAVPVSRNLRVPYGTSVSEILAYCHAQEDATVILGDAMTGTACPDIHTPLLPGTTTLLALQPRAVRLPQPCIGCGRCAEVCHAGLLPYEIVRRLENMHYERLQHLSAWECDGCDACSYVCPSHRPVADDVLRAGETGGTMFLDWGGDSDE